MFFPKPIRADEWEKIVVWAWRQRRRRERLLYVIAMMSARDVAARARIYGGEEEWFFDWGQLGEAWLRG